MTTAPLVADVVALLLEAGWRRRWASCENAATSPAGSVAALYYRDGADAVTVELEAAATRLVETLELDPTAGAARIARIIIAATEEPTP